MSTTEAALLRPRLPNRTDRYGTAYRLVVEGRELVGYGWGGRRYAVPLARIAWLERLTFRRYATIRPCPERDLDCFGLSVIGLDEQVLLRVDGRWPADEVRAFGITHCITTMIDVDPEARNSRALSRHRGAGYRRMRLGPLEGWMSLAGIPGALAVPPATAAFESHRDLLGACCVLVTALYVTAVVTALLVVGRANQRRALAAPRLDPTGGFDSDVRRARAEAYRAARVALDDEGPDATAGNAAATAAARAAATPGPYNGWRSRGDSRWRRERNTGAGRERGRPRRRDRARTDASAQRLYDVHDKIPGERRP